jgi:hypothetical protein
MRLVIATQPEPDERGWGWPSDNSWGIKFKPLYCVADPNYISRQITPFTQTPGTKCATSNFSLLGASNHIGTIQTMALIAGLVFDMLDLSEVEGIIFFNALAYWEWFFKSISVN